MNERYSKMYVMNDIIMYVCMRMYEGEIEKKRESFIYSDSPLTRCKARTELLNDVHQILSRGF